MSCSDRVLRREIQFTNTDSGRDLWIRLKVAFGELYQSLGEFDPGSGRTLAACLTHASQGGIRGNLGATGERVRNT